MTKQNQMNPDLTSTASRPLQASQLKKYITAAAPVPTQPVAMGFVSLACEPRIPSHGMQSVGAVEVPRGETSLSSSKS